MKNRFLKQASHEYKPGQRLFALLFLAPVFLLVLPILEIKLGAKLDQWLALPFVINRPFSLIFGGLLILSGWGFGMWSIYSQFTIGRGTPLPLIPTQQLVVQAPYNYCRNPMALGAIALYLGISILFQSYGAVILVILFAVSLIIYIKRVEEKEMEIRFGGEYLDYQQRTPFLFPRFWHRPGPNK